jgi:hypothetical protein
MSPASHPDRLLPDRLLRSALRANAAFSGLCGLAGAIATAAIAAALGPPEPIVLSQGVTLIGFSAALVWLATRAEISLRLALTVVVLDLLWVATTAAPLLASGQLTSLGVPIVLGLSVIVLGFAYFQYQGVQRARGSRGVAATS